MLLELIVKVHHMKYVHKLALILMEPLYLHIKDASGIHLYTVALLNILGKAYLVLLLYVHELTLSLEIIGIDLQLLEPLKIGDPFGSYLVRDPV